MRRLTVFTLSLIVIVFLAFSSNGEEIKTKVKIPVNSIECQGDKCVAPLPDPVRDQVIKMIPPQWSIGQKLANRNSLYQLVDFGTIGLKKLKDAKAVVLEVDAIVTGSALQFKPIQNLR